MTEVLSLQQLTAEGQGAYQRGEYQSAIRAFHAAAQGYEVQGDHLMAAEMRNNLSVVYNRAGEAQAAWEAVEGTPAVFAAANDPRRQGIALGNLGAALESLKRFPEAAQAYEQAADLLEQSGESDLRAYVLKSLSRLKLRSGRTLEALLTMQVGLDGMRRPTLPQRFLRRMLTALTRALPR